MAEIQMAQGQYVAARQSLEVGLSYNFKVREHPVYHLIKARLEKRQGSFEEAVETLRTAMSLPAFKSKNSTRFRTQTSCCRVP
jgi:tetratricopeptide repeat protein 21B